MNNIITALSAISGSMAKALGRRTAFAGEIPTFGYQAKSAPAKSWYPGDMRDHETRQADRKLGRRRAMRLRRRRGRS